MYLDASLLLSRCLTTALSDLFLKKILTSNDFYKILQKSPRIFSNATFTRQIYNIPHHFINRDWAMVRSTFGNRSRIRSKIIMDKINTQVKILKDILPQATSRLLVSNLLQWKRYCRQTNCPNILTNLTTPSKIQFKCSYSLTLQLKYTWSMLYFSIYTCWVTLQLKYPWWVTFQFHYPWWVTLQLKYSCWVTLQFK